MIPDDIKDRVLESTDLVALVSQTVKLRKSGPRYVGCCPFHGEKTPSFFVFPHTGTYKCFGCGDGGDAISFLQKRDGLPFVDAVKQLGKMCGVEVDEQEEDPQAKQKRMHKEALMVANEQVATFYAKQLAQSKEAQDYAYKRWGESYVKQKGLGFAPTQGKALTNLPIKREFLDELGLVNKGGYDQYQGRIVIPIRSRYGNVIGFTARSLGDEQPKYKNSADSILFHKSQVLFGIEDAWRQAAKADKFFLVEGAPDCMRMQSIGVLNCVAALGSSWNKEHFALIKKSASKVCFLPDDDPPKRGEFFGHGIAVILAAGKLAMECGLSVTVKEIPDHDKEHKQDPDSYYQNLNIFNAVDEVDFILWRAAKTFGTAQTTEDQRVVVREIAYLLTLVDDPTGVSMYIDRLSHITGKKSLWKEAISAEKKRIEEDEKRERGEAVDDLFKRFGFYVENGKYYSITEKGNTYEWSNFTMQPLFHIKDNLSPKRLYIIKNELNMKVLIELNQEDLVSISKFKQRIEGQGNYIWKATERELTKLKSYLYEKTETASQVKQMGWQREGFYAFGNGVFFQDKFYNADEYGIVRLPDLGNFYLPSSSKIYKDDARLFTFEKQFVHLNYSSVTLEEFSRQLFTVFGNNGRVGFAFYLATLFRDVVTNASAEHWFPILNLFGPKGSGKSELGHTLLSLFTIAYKAPNIQNSTISALNDTVAASANALAHIDEYKNDLDPKLIEFLKGLWDGTGRSRMNMDLDKKKEVTAVDAGIILSGQEMPTADIALFSRLIFLQFPRSVFTNEEKKNYMRLMEMRSGGLTHITLFLLKQRKRFEQRYATVLAEVRKDMEQALKGHQCEDRIVNNWSVPLAALKCLQDVVPALTYKDLFNVVIEGILKQNAECKTNGELGAFWNVVQYLSSEGIINESGDYAIRYLTHLKTDVVDIAWVDKKAVLYMQTSRIFNLYRKEGRKTDDKTIPTDALKYYLANSAAYLGQKVARFIVFRNGFPVLDSAKKDKNGNLSKLSQSARSYVFDYKKLMDQFGIRLGTDDDEGEEEE